MTVSCRLGSWRLKAQLLDKATCYTHCPVSGAPSLTGQFSETNNRKAVIESGFPNGRQSVNRVLLRPF